MYLFFTSALSVFDSFAFNLYFYGNALLPGNFPLVGKPKKIITAETAKAFADAFPGESITKDVGALSNDARFRKIDSVRNVVGHRLSGRRGMRFWSTPLGDGSYARRKEQTWNLPGSETRMTLDANMLKGRLDDVTALLSELSKHAREFSEQRQ